MAVQETGRCSASWSICNVGQLRQLRHLIQQQQRQESSQPTKQCFSIANTITGNMELPHGFIKSGQSTTTP